jgi:hypothetical protein
MELHENINRLTNINEEFKSREENYQEEIRILKTGSLEAQANFRYKNKMQIFTLIF